MQPEPSRKATVCLRSSLSISSSSTEGWAISECRNKKARGQCLRPDARTFATSGAAAEEISECVTSPWTSINCAEPITQHLGRCADAVCRPSRAHFWGALPPAQQHWAPLPLHACIVCLWGRPMGTGVPMECRPRMQGMLRRAPSVVQQGPPGSIARGCCSCSARG